MTKQGVLSQKEIMLKYLSWLDTWVFKYELCRTNTPYGFLSHNAYRRAQELYEKGLLERREVDGKVQFKYLKEPLQSNLSEKEPSNTQTTIKEPNQAVMKEYPQIEYDKRSIDEQFADIVKNTRLDFGKTAHIEANRLLGILKRAKKEKDIKNLKSQILWLLK